MKFAFIWHALMDCVAGHELCRALCQLDQDAIALRPNQRAADLLQDFDVIIEVNHARDDGIPLDAVHVAWVQEYYGAGDPHYQNALAHDFIYTYGEPEIIGCPRFTEWRGSLCVGVKPELLDRPLSVEPTLDFSLAGWMAPPDWFSVQPAQPQGDSVKLWGDVVQLINKTTEVRPLTGSFDQARAFAKFRFELVQHFAKRRNFLFSVAAMDDCLVCGAKHLHDYARAMHRLTLATRAIAVSDSIEIWGPNWEQWPLLKPFAKPFCMTDALLDLYQRSRINLHDNIFGFAQHSRVLEAMAVGGFVMANESPHTGKAGQLTETFAPDEHYGEYNADNFSDAARFWLSDPIRRKCAAHEARRIVKAKHLWQNRAEQLLADLAA